MRHSKGSMKRAFRGALALAVLLLPRAAVAWTFPEHERISETAIRSLADDDITAASWHAFRASVDPELRLCAEADEKKLTGREEEKATCVPAGALPALAGDHSCTPQDLAQQLRENAGWIFKVLGVANATQRSLDGAGTDVADREAARRAMHIDLQDADSQYVSRAVLDYSHFQLSREGSGTDRDGLRAFLRVALAPNAQSNATAAYVNYHAAALRAAAAARFEPDAKAKKTYFTRALLAEAFALHFLEDSFSTGHFVGHWGDTATRLGTHDYYSGAGFQASRWSEPGKTYVAHGDAFLSDAERLTAANAVKASLWQVVEVATDDQKARDLVAKFGKGFSEEGYDSCAEERVAPGLSAFAEVELVAAVLREEPVPATRYPEVPRMRAENGVFFGAAATVGTGWVGVEQSMNTRVMASLRAGYGAAGLVNDPLNAQLFVESGFIGQRLYDGSGTSLTGFYFRTRGPGYFAFLDGWIGIPLALAFKGDCPFCVSWAAAAGGGGLLRVWRERHLLGRLSVQISALRDATITLFPHQPRDGANQSGDGRMRVEVFAPVGTFRYFWPVSAGSSWSQSTDAYLDAGPSVTWVDGNTARFGVFASFSVSPRVFP